MSRPNLSEIQNIALLNFGGIGDEILFAPVIQELKKYLPNSHIALFLEERSRSVASLLPDINETYGLEVQKTSRPHLFFKLAKKLKSRHFDLVISSGSSPFIAPMLWLSGTPLKFGFKSKSSDLFLTRTAPLDLKGYAGDMYFSLAEACLKELLGEAYLPPASIVPSLAKPNDGNTKWAKTLLKKENNLKKVLIHPGVSKLSIEKGIVKSWSAESWSTLIQRLVDKDETLDVFLAGGPDDQNIISQIMEKLPAETPRFSSLYGETKNLEQLAALVNEADLLVSVDSAPMHISVGMNTPVIALFGELDPVRLLPAEEHFIAIQQEKPTPNSLFLNIPVSVVESAINQRF